MPASKIIAATFSGEPNPPLYFLLLHVWMAFAGTSEFGLRSLSAVCGVATVALIYRLGRDALSCATGAAAAVLIACAPFLIWYSQEARAFSLLAACATGLLVAQVRVFCKPTPWRWVCVAVLATATLYSHFFGLFSVLASGTLFVIAWVTRVNVRAAWWRGITAYGAAVGLYVPWLVATLRAGAANTSWRAAASLGDMAWRTAVASAHGGFLPNPWGSVFTQLCVALAVVGGITSWRYGREKALAGSLLLVSVVGPTLAIWAVSQRQAIFAEPYVIAQAPLFLLAIAAVASIRAPVVRSLRFPLVGLLAFVSLAALRFSWTSPSNAKEDFRLAATYFDQHIGANDAIVVVADYAAMPFGYYYRGKGTVIPFRGDFNRPGDFLEPQLVGADRVWLLLSHSEQADPKGAVQRWMTERYPVMTEAYPQGIQIRGYRATYRLRGLPREAEPANARFGDSVELVGLATESGVPAREALLRPPKDNNWLHVTLYLRRIGPVGVQYRTLVRLADSKGIWGETFDRPTEALRFYPPQNWRTDEIVADDVDVNINTKTPPGMYRLWVRILGPDGKDLPTGAGPVIVSHVTIAAP